MTMSRRRFIESAAAISLGFTGLGCATSQIAKGIDPGRRDIGVEYHLKKPEYLVVLYDNGSHVSGLPNALN